MFSFAIIIYQLSIINGSKNPKGLQLIYIFALPFKTILYEISAHIKHQALEATTLSVNGQRAYQKKIKFGRNDFTLNRGKEEKVSSKQKREEIINLLKKLVYEIKNFFKMSIKYLILFITMHVCTIFIFMSGSYFNLIVHYRLSRRDKVLYAVRWCKIRMMCHEMFWQCYVMYMYMLWETEIKMKYKAK